MEDQLTRTKKTKHLDPMNNSVNKEGQIQSMQVQGRVLSNNQIDKYCLEEHLLGRSSAEDDTGLVVHMVQT